MKIGLLDHLGGGNLGDDATMDTLMQGIRKRWPEAEIYGFSMNPSDTRERHGIPSYPIRRDTWSSPHFSNDNHGPSFRQRMKSRLARHRLLSKTLRMASAVMLRMPREAAREMLFLARSFSILRSLDMLIIGGGGQLLDSWGGPWKYPYTILKWVVLAKLSRLKCYFVNVGAGPLSSPLGRRFVRRALSLADYTSFRDDKSRELVQQIGFIGSAPVHPDSVYGLEFPFLRVNGKKPGGRVVGISPMAYCDPRIYWDKNQAVYDRFIQTMARFCVRLIEAHYSLVLFSTDIWFDAPAIEDLKVALAGEAGAETLRHVEHAPVATIEQLLLQVSLTDYVVTCRFHGVIFAHLLNKPVLALSHHSKVATLMTDIGLSDYCVDIRNLDADALVQRFRCLAREQEHIKRLMAEKREAYQRELAVQFDSLFCSAARAW